MCVLMCQYVSACVCICVQCACVCMCVSLCLCNNTIITYDVCCMYNITLCALLQYKAIIIIRKYIRTLKFNNTVIIAF